MYQKVEMSAFVEEGLKGAINNFIQEKGYKHYDVTVEADTKDACSQEFHSRVMALLGVNSGSKVHFVLSHDFMSCNLETLESADEVLIGLLS